MAQKNPKGQQGKSNTNKKDDDFGLPEVNLNPLEEGLKPTSTPKKTTAPSSTKPIPKMEENTNSSTENTELSNKNGLVAGIVIALIVLIGALVYYNFFYQKEEPVIVQQEAPKPAPAPVEPEPVIEEPIVEEVVPTLEYVQSRAGRYFVIVGSFIDDDLAADLAKKLMSEGTSCKIIYPFGNKLFYRLSVSDFDNVQDALAHAESIQANFEEKLWVLKY